VKIGDKKYENPTNLSEKKCPLCGKLLRYKPPCCSDKTMWLICPPCDYKEKYDN
jgi:hypothetical protein